MKMSKITLLVLVIFGFTGTVAHAGDKAKYERILSLSGLGEVKSEPDMAIIRIGVVRESATAKQALAENNTAMRQVTGVVSAAGIAGKDMQTSGFSVNPRYVHLPSSSNGRQRPPRIVGYSVANTVTIIVRDLNRLGPVLDGVVRAGSNQINGVSFSISHIKPLRNKARRLATADAIAKAKLYAKAGGFRLGKLLTVSEQGGYQQPQPVFARNMAMSMAADSVPVARGEQSVSIRVNMSWAIE